MICTCKVCGTQFEAKHKTAVCSNCNTAVCVVCGNKFELKYPYTGTTCSRKCSSKLSRAKAQKTIQARYGLSSLREVQGSKSYTKVCKYCSKEFVTHSPRQQYCGDDYGPCPVCGKLVKILDMHTGPTCCSEECRQKRIAATCISKYGNKCVLNSTHGKTLSEQTCLEKYGAKSYIESEIGQAAIKTTMLERFGVEHALQSPDILAKAQATNMERYGGVAPTASHEVIEKQKQTFSERWGGTGFASPVIAKKAKETSESKYGVEHPSQSMEVQSKMRATCQERYGIDSPLKSTDIRAKGKITSKLRYGTEYPSQSAEIKEKVAATVRSRFGVNNVFQSETIKRKIQQKLIECYGVDNPMKSQEVQQRAKDTCMEKYGSEYYNQSHERLVNTILDPTKVEEFQQFKDDPQKYIHSHYQNKPTLTTIAYDTGIDIATVSSYIIKHNLQSLIEYHLSNMEYQVKDFLQSLLPGAVIQTNVRTILEGKEIDIYLPEYHFGIECNPTISHNSSIGDPWSGDIKPYNYHQIKSLISIDKGVFLFHLFGYEWTHRQEIIKSMLTNYLGKSENRIYARKCKIVEVSSKIASQFLNDNHRQGATAAKIRLGLEYEGKLVSLMTFNRARSTLGKIDDKNGWELSRFCNQCNTSVIGGASKLFKYFIDHYEFDYIFSFSDVAHTQGNLYSILGFTSGEISNPGYVWVNLQDDSYLTRVACQKKNLPKLFNEPNLDIENQTEREIMITHGYVQVFDSGVIRWTYYN